MMFNFVEFLCYSIASCAGHVSLPVPLITTEGTEAGIHFLSRTEVDFQG